MWIFRLTLQHPIVGAKVAALMFAIEFFKQLGDCLFFVGLPTEALSSWEIADNFCDRLKEYAS